MATLFTPSLPGLQRLYQMSEQHLRLVLPELFGRLLVRLVVPRWPAPYAKRR